MAQNQWNAWTLEQDERLRATFAAGSSAVLVAAKLKRKVSAITRRAQLLKISVKRKKVELKPEK